MTLVEFLLARIAEDETDARNVLRSYASHEAHWSCPSTGVVDLGDPGIEGLLVTGDGPVAYHIERWDPARVLAECEAKRRLVEEYQAGLTETDGSERLGYPFDPILSMRMKDARHVLRVIAAVYADHPDYDGSWRS